VTEAAAADGRRPARVARRLGTVLALGLVAGLLALLVWKVVHQQSATGFVNRIAAGDKPLAPGFTLKRLDGPGGKVSLASLRGHPVVVNFWASWCDPCKAEAGRLESSYRAWGGKGVRFVGVDANDFTADGRRFAAKHGLSYLNLADGAGSTLGRWGVTGLPETFFVDAKGRAVAHVVGEISSSELAAGIEKARS
jgi:cytochrome c biogenesis protein CcmG/thiol:disulfide interchange protein DsbE